jgi:hypothetical protein
MTKGKRTKRSAASHSQTRVAERCGIAKRGGWVDQRVAEILQSSAPLPEKARLVYDILAAEPPIPGNHLAPLEVIRINLARRFPTLAREDGPLSQRGMPGTVYMVLKDVIQKWSPAKAGRSKRDGGASFITYLTNHLVWDCQRYLEQESDRLREIPVSELLLLRDRSDGDGIDEDYVLDLGCAPALDLEGLL